MSYHASNFTDIFDVLLINAKLSSSLLSIQKCRVIGDSAGAESVETRQIQIPKNIIIHPDFDKSTFTNDIAIVLVCIAHTSTLNLILVL